MKEKKNGIEFLRPINKDVTQIEEIYVKYSLHTEYESKNGLTKHVGINAKISENKVTLTPFNNSKEDKRFMFIKSDREKATKVLELMLKAVKIDEK